MRLGILRALLAVFSATSLTKVVGAAKVALVARYYGVGDELDAYWIAFLIPSFVGDIVGTSTAPALIPAFVKSRDKSGPEAAQRLVASVTAMGVALCMLLLAIVVMFGDALLEVTASGFAPGKLLLTRLLLSIMAPLILAGGIGSVWRAVLNAHGEFALPAAAPIVTPAIIMAAIATAGSDRNAVVLAWATLAGGLLEVILLGFKLTRLGYSLIPRWNGLDEASRNLLSQYWPMLAAALLSGSAVYVSQSLAAVLGPGKVSALNYGNRLLGVFLALVPAVMGTVALPHFSERTAQGHGQELLAGLRRHQRTYWLAVLPATAILIWFSDAVIRLFLQGGQFSAADVPGVAEIQRCYLLQAPVAIPAVILARMFSSLGFNRVLMTGAGIHLACSAGLALVLMGSLGAAGIALAASLASYAYYCYLAFMLFRMEIRIEKTCIEKG